MKNIFLIFYCVLNQSAFSQIVFQNLRFELRDNNIICTDSLNLSQFTVDSFNYKCYYYQKIDNYEDVYDLFEKEDEINFVRLKIVKRTYNSITCKLYYNTNTGLVEIQEPLIIYSYISSNKAIRRFHSVICALIKDFDCLLPKQYLMNDAKKNILEAYNLFKDLKMHVFIKTKNEQKLNKTYFLYINQ